MLVVFFVQYPCGCCVVVPVHVSVIPVVLVSFFLLLLYHLLLLDHSLMSSMVLALV